MMTDQEKQIGALRSFIAEFELWLEAEHNNNPSYDGDEWKNGYSVGIEYVLDKYRLFKQRIEYNNDEKESE